MHTLIRPTAIRPMVFVALAWVATSAFAQSPPMRCRGDLAQVGDSKASVLHKCGAPVFEDSFCKPVERHAGPASAAGRSGVAVVPCERIEQWTYNPGRGQFLTYLRFEAGELRSITYGDRVQ